MAQSTTQLREAWKRYECKPDAMTVIDFGPDRIRVAPPAADAFRALASVMMAHGYQIRVDDTDSYNCRAIKGGSGRSLHSYGIALDVNWETNPFKETPNNRAVRFSDKPTQQERAQDVKLGVADTDMTPDMINDVLAIKTKNKKTVFEWGGNWKDRKDAMHFEMDVTPSELQAGIDWDTVKQSRAGRAVEHQGDLGGIAPPPVTIGAPSQPLTIGSRGDAVERLQRALEQRNFSVGEIDGIYGPMTEQAVRAFQSAQGLPQTGIADEATLRALMSHAVRSGGTTMNADDLLRTIISALIAMPQTGASPAGTAGTTQPGALNVANILQTLVRAVLARQDGVAPAQPSQSAAGTAAPTTTPVLSPIDQWLGGQALAGKKTALSVIAYAVLSVLQAVGVAGTATGATQTTTGQILTTLIAAFGGLGLTAKVDRVVQTLGLIAARPPAPK